MKRELRRIIEALGSPDTHFVTVDVEQKRQTKRIKITTYKELLEVLARPATRSVKLYGIQLAVNFDQ